MAYNALKCMRAENKSLQSLVSKLAGTIETIHLQLKQKDDALAKRRSEVATLHQACAKYKRARAPAPVRRRPPDRQAATSTIETVVLPTTSNASLINDAALCPRCQQATDVFAEKEAQLSSALREKDDEIGRLVTTLAERDRRDEEKREQRKQQKADEQERRRQYYEDTMREIAEMNERNKRMSRKHDEDWRLYLRRFDLRHVVMQRQRTGVADAA